MFLRTRAGYVPVRNIELIEDENADGFHPVHYHLGAGSRETVAHASCVNALLDRSDNDQQ